MSNKIFPAAMNDSMESSDISLNNVVADRELSPFANDRRRSAWEPDKHNTVSGGDIRGSTQIVSGHETSCTEESRPHNHNQVDNNFDGNGWGEHESQMSFESRSSKYSLHSMRSFRSSRNPLLGMLGKDMLVRRESTEDPEVPESHRSKWIPVLVISSLVGLTLTCAIVETLQLPACAFQCFLIFLASVKWERDSFVAHASQGVPRPWRVCCQLFLTILPLSIAFVIIFLFAMQILYPDTQVDSEAV